MTSMFPPWSIAPDATQVLSPFVQLYHAALKNQAVSVVRHPLSIAGFLMGKFVAQVDSFGGKDFLKKLYTVRVSAIGDVALGPFSDGTSGSCQETTTNSASSSSSSCSCNVGPRVVNVFPLDALFGGSNNKSGSFMFSGCHVTYLTPSEPAPSNLGTILLVVIPIVVAVLAVAGQKLLRKHLAAAKVTFAPKDATAPVATMIVALKKESSLWERYPASMP
eukprot:PhM_4_TR9132/c0_g2_i1/m.34690